MPQQPREPIVVDIEGVGVVEFPPEMSEAQVVSILRQQRGPLRRFWEQAGPRLNPINVVTGLVQGAQQAWTDAPRYGGGGLGFGTAFAGQMARGLAGEAKTTYALAREGDVAGAAGVVGANAALLAGPKAARAIVPSRLTARVPGMTPPAVVQDAITYGRREGIPIDAATATGNPFIARVQQLAGQTTIPGAAVSMKAGAVQDAAIQGVMKRTAERVRRGGEVTPAQAGEETTGALRQRVTDLKTKADVNYDTFRQVEQDPRNLKKVPLRVKMTDPQGNVTIQTVMRDVPLPVDLRPLKASLRPVLKEMRLRSTTAQKQADPGLRAIEVVMERPDFVKASVAEADLGALKRLVRPAPSMSARNTSQGLAARAVAKLQADINTAVRAAHDPRGTLALHSGRRLTAAKWYAQGLLEKLEGTNPQFAEPVGAFKKLTRNDDAAITLLDRVTKREPQVAPLLGRAVLDQIFEKGFERGTLGRAAGMFRDWHNLGPRTKARLYGTRVADLDRLFLLMDRIAVNPNPSGTGSAVVSAVNVGALWANPVAALMAQIGGYGLAKLLHTDAGVRALTRGVQIAAQPQASKLAVAGAVGEIQRAAEAARVPLRPVPAELPLAADEGAPDR